MTAADANALLTDAERRALGNLWFTAARPVEGLYAGRHRSPLKGHSTEFHDYRPYALGDETRSIDWKLFGRTDRLYVRRFRHDAELAVHLMIDTSASMDFDGLNHAHSKWRATCKLAAAIAHLVIAQQDRFSLTLLGERTTAALPLGGSWAHWQQLCATLGDVRPAGFNPPESGDVKPSAASRGLVVLISDLMDDPAVWLNMVGRWIAQRQDVAVFQVLHRDEMHLPPGPAFRAVDSETHQSVMTDSATRALCAELLRDHMARLRSGLSGHGVDHQVMLADKSPIDVLGGYIWARTAGPRSAS